MKDESKEADSFHPTLFNTYMQFLCTHKEHVLSVREGPWRGALSICDVPAPLLLPAQSIQF